jgi:hypothetical protein
MPLAHLIEWIQIPRANHLQFFLTEMEITSIFNTSLAGYNIGNYNIIVYILEIIYVKLIVNFIGFLYK